MTYHFIIDVIDMWKISLFAFIGKVILIKLEYVAYSVVIMKSTK
jgi:hypothetical protein